MARFTETGAFAGAEATPLRKSAALPGVVGPDEGKELAGLTDAAASKTAAPINNFRTAILTVTSVSAGSVPAGCFSKIVAPDKHNFLAQHFKERRFSIAVFSQRRRLQTAAP
jgi:hypothetical protein